MAGGRLHRFDAAHDLLRGGRHQAARRCKKSGDIKPSNGRVCGRALFRRRRLLRYVCRRIVCRAILFAMGAIGIRVLRILLRVRRRILFGYVRCRVVRRAVAFAMGAIGIRIGVGRQRCRCRRRCHRDHGETRQHFHHLHDFLRFLMRVLLRPRFLEGRGSALERCAHPLDRFDRERFHAEAARRSLPLGLRSYQVGRAACIRNAARLSGSTV
jgi:hypothetical protein